MFVVHLVRFMGDRTLFVQSLIAHIYLQRRRLLLTGVFAFAAGYFMYSHIVVIKYGMPFPLWAGMFYMVAVVLAAAVTSYVFPRLRRLIDSITVSRFCFALWIVSTGNHELISAPVVGASIVVGSAILLLHLGTWVENLRTRSTVIDARFAIVKRVALIVDWIDNTAEYDMIHSPAAVQAHLS